MQLVTLRELADEMGLHRATALKWLRKASAELGIKPGRARPIEANGQAAVAWRRNDAERLLAHRRAQGFQVPKPSAASAIAAPRERAAVVEDDLRVRHEAVERRLAALEAAGAQPGEEVEVIPEPEKPPTTSAED